MKSGKGLMTRRSKARYMGRAYGNLEGVMVCDIKMRANRTKCLPQQCFQKSNSQTHISVANEDSPSQVHIDIQAGTAAGK